MERTIIILGLVYSFWNSSCQGSSSQNNNLQVDTTKSMKISNYWVTPKPSFELNTIIDSSQDTLKLVSCAEYVYSPFGKLDKKSDIKNSLLNNFLVTNRLDTLENGVFEFQILKAKSSKLILFFDNDPEATKHSSIFKGEITDKDVHLLNDIKIGMDKKYFIMTFFDYFPVQLLSEFNYIVFESCVLDISHTYKFKADKLQSIDFKTDSYWNINY
jgi:hypothetical protein